MYTLYYSPSACSLATQAILNLLGQEVRLIDAGTVENFEEINPSKLVPVLKDGERYLTEGAAIILYLLNKHENNLLPEIGELRQSAIENMMMANATVHPAYGRLFFASGNMAEGEAKNEFLRVSANAINSIWKTIEDKITDGPYLGGRICFTGRYSVSCLFPLGAFLSCKHKDWAQNS